MVKQSDKPTLSNKSATVTKEQIVTKPHNTVQLQPVGESIYESDSETKELEKGPDTQEKTKTDSINLVNLVVNQVADYNVKEQERILKMVASGKGRDGVYKVGDYYNRDGNIGVVFRIEDGGKQGSIITAEYTSAMYEQAKSWCNRKGQGWRLPTISELLYITERLNNVEYRPGVKFKISGSYWCSDGILVTSYKGGYKEYYFPRANKQNTNSVRAVYDF